MSESETDADVRRRVRSRRVALVTVCLVMFLTFMDMTIVSVALGSVRSDLHAGVTQLQWVVNGYGLTFASFMLLGGTSRGSTRTQEGHVARSGPVRGGLLVGALATHLESVDRCARHHGGGSGGVGTRNPVGAASDVPRRSRARARHRHVGRRVGTGAGLRTGHRWRPGRAGQLAGGLLVQRGRRRRDHRPGDTQRARVLESPERTSRLGGFVLGRTRSRGAHLRRDPG